MTLAPINIQQIIRWCIPLSQANVYEYDQNRKSNADWLLCSLFYI